VQVDALLGRDFSRQRCGSHVALIGSGGNRFGCLGFVFGCGSLFGGRCGFGLFGRLIDGADDRTDDDNVALACGGADDAGRGCGQLHRDLVGLEFEHGLVAFDVLAVFLGPGGDDTFGDGFADCWDDDVHCHVFSVLRSVPRVRAWGRSSGCEAGRPR